MPRSVGRKTLLLAIHNHQPDGNFDEVFQKSHDLCYRPLVDLLLEFPLVRCALHFTGALYEWIERNRSELFGKIRALVERQQVELLGGGFYEPMLAVLPRRDALGQLSMMSDYLESHFGVRPRGMWLAERVWEPSLPTLLFEAGLTFTMLDDGHFRYAGMEGRLKGYYVTENAGAPTAVFPIDKDLRYAIPFRLAHEVVDLVAGLPDGAYTYGDDGEKFGLWPGTHEWVWDKGWLRQFFVQLEAQKDAVETQTFSRYLAEHPPTGRVYLPTASYEEMGEWTLPAEAQRHYVALRHDLEGAGTLERARPYLRGGIWQNFLAKYDEANFMHKKMVYVSGKVAAAEQAAGHTLEPARRELYRAQCNCAYWHGLFGGLYLGYLRHAVYTHLITAEMAVEKLTLPRVVRKDYDADLEEELLMEGPALAAYVRPARGGAVSEIDERTRRTNLLNVLSRRDEGYHGRLREAARAEAAPGGASPRSIHDLARVKEPGLEALLVHDRHLRLGFLDHFLAPGTTLESFANAAYEEAGDFAGGRYQVVSAAGAVVELSREGLAYGRRLTVRKRLHLDGRALRVAYHIASDEPTEILFAPELPLFLDTDEHRQAGRAELFGGVVRLRHDWLGLVLGLRALPETTVWRFPLETASQSESGFERTYQGTVFLPVWRAALSPGVPLERHFELEIEDA